MSGSTFLVEPTLKQQRLYEVARAVSRTSEFPRVNIGAILIKNTSIISTGVNKQKEHPLQKYYNSFRFDQEEMLDDSMNHFLHAEIDTIVKVRYRDIVGSTMFIFREDASENLAMSRPCSACFQALREFKISEIYYTDINGFKYEKVY